MSRPMSDLTSIGTTTATSLRAMSSTLLLKTSPTTWDRDPATSKAFSGKTPPTTPRPLKTSTTWTSSWVPHTGPTSSVRWAAQLPTSLKTLNSTPTSTTSTQVRTPSIWLSVAPLWTMRSSVHSLACSTTLTRSTCFLPPSAVTVPPTLEKTTATVYSHRLRSVGLPPRKTS